MRVKRVDYGKGSDFWLPCLGGVERFWARIMTTGSPMTILPTPVPKGIVDTSFAVAYPYNAQERIDAFIAIMEAIVVITVIDETPVEFYYLPSAYAASIAIATANGATNPCDYDCMCLSYELGFDTNPL